MKINIITLEYTVVRKVEIITNELLTDDQLETIAREKDTVFEEGLTAPVLAIRRILKNSPCQVTSIERTELERTQP